MSVMREDAKDVRSPMDQAVQAANDAMSELQERVERLREKLNPVLGPDRPVPTSDAMGTMESKMPDHSPLVGAVRDLQYRAGRITGQLDGLTARLEV